LFYGWKQACRLDGVHGGVALARVNGKRQDDDTEELCLSIINGSVANAVDVPLWLAPRLEALLM
jgi:hypothetical protein